MSVRAALTAMLVCAGAVVVFAQPSPSADAIERSGFIFAGTVQRLASSNVKTLPAAANTVVVRVDEILKAPPTFASYRGKEITVQLQRASALQPQQQAVFYTSGLLYGESLAVREVLIVPGASDLKAIADQIAQNEQQTAERALAARVSSASLIVSGRVTEVASVTPRSSRRSEHDPDLWLAWVDVSAVLKGRRTSGGRLGVLFAHSTDERWILSPKYTPGQSGIFLLHSNDVHAKGRPEYSTLDRLDFQPDTQLSLVRRLVGERR